MHDGKQPNLGTVGGPLIGNILRFPLRRAFYPKLGELVFDHRPSGEIAAFFSSLIAEHTSLSRLYLTPHNLKSWLGNIIILEKRERSFYYRLYGQKVSDVSGLNLTGQSIDAFPTASKSFIVHYYNKVLQTAEIVVTAHAVFHDWKTLVWLRVICPVPLESPPQIVLSNYPIQVPQRLHHTIAQNKPYQADDLCPVRYADPAIAPEIWQDT